MTREMVYNLLFYRTPLYKDMAKDYHMFRIMSRGDYRLNNKGSDVDMGIETAILGLIGQYGLPVVLLVVCGWFLLKRFEKYLDSQQKKDDDNRKYMVDRIEKSEERQEKSEKRQEELIAMGRDISETNRILAEKFTGELCGIKQEVNDIGNKVDIINIKLDSK